MMHNSLGWLFDLALNIISYINDAHHLQWETNL
jgi:hypothetical protein